MKLVVVSAGLSEPSSTRLLADRLSQSVVADLGARSVAVDAQVIELRQHAHDITTQLLRGFGTPGLDEAIRALTDADGAIVVTPIFTTSYSGLFKSFFDILDPDALTGLPVLIGATGGTERHSLALDYAIRPLFSYLHAAAVPTGVYAATSDWGSAETGLPARIERAGKELAREMSRPDGAERPARMRNEFALPAGFDPSGGFGGRVTNSGGVVANSAAIDALHDTRMSNSTMGRDR